MRSLWTFIVPQGSLWIPCEVIMDLIVPRGSLEIPCEVVMDLIVPRGIVCYRVIADPYVRSVVVSLHTITLLMMIPNTQWTMRSLYPLKFFL